MYTFFHESKMQNYRKRGKHFVHNFTGNTVILLFISSAPEINQIFFYSVIKQYMLDLDKQKCMSFHKCCYKILVSQEWTMLI